MPLKHTLSVLPHHIICFHGKWIYRTSPQAQNKRRMHQFADHYELLQSNLLSFNPEILFCFLLGCIDVGTGGKGAAALLMFCIPIQNITFQRIFLYMKSYIVVHFFYINLSKYQICLNMVKNTNCGVLNISPCSLRTDYFRQGDKDQRRKLELSWWRKGLISPPRKYM